MNKKIFLFLTLMLAAYHCNEFATSPTKSVENGWLPVDQAASRRRHNCSCIEILLTAYALKIKLTPEELEHSNRLNFGFEILKCSELNINREIS